MLLRGQSSYTTDSTSTHLPEVRVLLCVCVTTLIAQQILTKPWASYWKCTIKWQITYTCLDLKTGWVYNKFHETSKMPKYKSSKLRKFVSKTGAIVDLQLCVDPLCHSHPFWRLTVLVARMTGRSWQFAQLTVTCHLVTNPKEELGIKLSAGNENHASALGYVWKQHHAIHTDELGAGRAQNPADSSHLHS